jgi:hypothetical protein
MKTDMPRPLTACTTWRLIPVMPSVGRCGVVRLQMKFGHMDGTHYNIDGTSILAKIKSAVLYNCRTVYICDHISLSST